MPQYDELTRQDRAGKQAERETDAAQRIVDLKSKNPRLRVEAAKRLGDLHLGTEALLLALKDPNAQVRAAAAQSLGSSAEDAEGRLRQEVCESLLAAIDDENDFACAAAVQSLGRLKLEESRAEILICLEDKSSYVVDAAVLALARLGPPEVAEHLESYLDSQNDWIKASAVRAMGILGHTQAGPKLTAILVECFGKPVRDRHDFLVAHTIRAIAQLRVVEAVPILIQIAQREVGLRTRAVQALIELNDERAAPLLVELLNDPSSSLQVSLVKMMMRADYRPAVVAIRPLLKNQNSQVRQTAMEAVIHFKDTAALEDVRQICFSDSNPFLRARAVHGLAGLAGEGALPDFCNLVQDSNAYVRQAVVEAIGSQGLMSPWVIETILMPMAESDPSPQVVEAARRILDNQVDLAPYSRTNDLPAGDSLRSIRKAKCLPQATQTKTERLLADLQEWQQGLSDLVSRVEVEELDQADRALSILIQNLKGTEEK
jgi:HEAT repeat protein